MFSAASTAPAPRPYGTAHRHRSQKEWETEKPNNAAAVISTLTAVTGPAPSRRVSRSESRLETMVPQAIIMVTMPANETGTPSSACMTGQAEPMSESGRPRLIKAR